MPRYKESRKGKTKRKRKRNRNRNRNRKGRAETLSLSQLTGKVRVPNYDDIKKLWAHSSGCCLPPPLPLAAEKEGSNLHRPVKDLLSCH
jgi:hypothetical protein